MKILSVKIYKAEACGGLLDDLYVLLRPVDTPYDIFDPLCLIGPNGSGKSQFMQVVAEIFQTICHAVKPEEERVEANSTLQFEIEYLIRTEDNHLPRHVRAVRKPEGRKPLRVSIFRKTEGEWRSCDVHSDEARSLLPHKVIGYTSGENETLSLPFFVSRSGYASEVRENALDDAKRGKRIPDTLLMLIDYATNLEVLVANQLLSKLKQREAIFADSNVKAVHSCRCIVQLKIRMGGTRKAVKLTDELKDYIENLRKCSTCYHYDKKSLKYIFDFRIDGEMRSCFASFWNSALDLYAAFHKLAMLNDLAIPKESRERYGSKIKGRRFASRLPEPQDEDKVFRFEQVMFRPTRNQSPVDYVSLSDGEHQRTQIFGIMAMQSSPNVLFLMDEPESHFNPQWRVEFVSRVVDLPTDNGKRNEMKKSTRVDEQEFFLTTHGPFVPSDMPAESVFIFQKDGHTVGYHHPPIETYGTTFDSIVQTCFGVVPPISSLSRDDIDRLLKSNDLPEIESALDRFGPSVKKAFLIERARQLRSDRGKD